jgi:hypothetical protein
MSWCHVVGFIVQALLRHLFASLIRSQVSSSSSPPPPPPGRRNGPHCCNAKPISASVSLEPRSISRFESHASFNRASSSSSSFRHIFSCLFICPLLFSFPRMTARHHLFFQALYDQDHDLKKQLDALLKQEEHLQKLFDEKEEAMGGCMLCSSASGIF